MPRLTPEEWQEARRLYEQEGVTQAEIGRRFNVSKASVRDQKRRHGWDNGKPSASVARPPVVIDAPADPDTAYDGPSFVTGSTATASSSVTGPASTPDEAYVKTLEAELAEVRAELEEVRPTSDISARLFENTADVRAYFDTQALRDNAEAELAKLNSERLRRGFLPYEWDEETWETKVEEAAQALVGDRTRFTPTEGLGVRALKMVNPNSGNLVQIQVEDQINNQAGSIADGITKFRNKGFKIASPFLCAMRDCWQVAETGPTGKFAFQGYCSAEHMRRTEGAQIAEGLPGLMEASRR